MKKILLSLGIAAAVAIGTGSTATVHAADDVVETRTSEVEVANDESTISEFVTSNENTVVEAEEITIPEVPTDPPAIPETGTGSGNEGGTTIPEVPIDPPVIPGSESGTENGNVESGGETGENTIPPIKPIDSGTGAGTVSEVATSSVPNRQNISNINILRGNESTGSSEKHGAQGLIQGTSQMETESEQNQLPKTGNTKTNDFIIFSIIASFGIVGIGIRYLKKYFRNL